MQSSNPAQEPPEISVVLVVGNRRLRSSQALESVLRQEGLERAEVIVIDAGDADATRLPGLHGDRVRHVPIPADAGFGTLKAEGVRRAKAPIVAFLEDHVEARPGWLVGLLQAFEDGWDAVGVEVHNANPEVGIGEAVGSINYGLWAPPMKAGPATMLAGNNAAYRKDALAAYGSDLERLLISDTVLQEMLVEDGGRLYAQPAAAIEHRNPTTLWTGVKAEFLYHWPYGAVRSEALNWSWSQRLKYILLAPGIVGLRWARLLRLMRTEKFSSTVKFFNAAVIALCLVTAAVAGQTLGILFGIRDSERRFTQFELNGPRPKSSELRH